MNRKTEDWDSYWDSFLINQREAYWAELRKNPAIDSELLRYFGYDFFHDGDFHFEEINLPESRVSARLSCPNIKRLKGAEASFMDSIWFRCTFYGVRHMSFQGLPPALEDRSAPPLFLHGRIASLEPIIENEPETWQSLKCRLMPQPEMLEIEFEWLVVNPLEPLAFDLIKNSPEYRIPWFTHDR